MDWNTWYGGLIAAGGGMALAALILAATKRLGLYSRVYDLFAKLHDLGMGYDIPIIGGKSETSIKDTFFSTLSDCLRGAARGIAKLPKYPDPGDRGV